MKTIVKDFLQWIGIGSTAFSGTFSMRNSDPTTLTFWATFIGIFVLSVIAAIFIGILFMEGEKHVKKRKWTLNGKLGLKG